MGRNFAALIRTIDSLQLTGDHKVATSADGKQGEDVVILPSPGAGEAKARLPQGWREDAPRPPAVAQPVLSR